MGTLLSQLRNSRRRFMSSSSHTTTRYTRFLSTTRKPQNKRPLPTNPPTTADGTSFSHSHTTSTSNRSHSTSNNQSQPNTKTHSSCSSQFITNNNSEAR